MKIFICVVAIVSSPATVSPVMMVTPLTSAPIVMAVSRISPSRGRRTNLKFLTSPINPTGGSVAPSAKALCPAKADALCAICSITPGSAIMPSCSMKKLSERISRRHTHTSPSTFSNSSTIMMGERCGIRSSILLMALDVVIQVVECLY